MTLTAPGSISNSGSRPFSNLFGRIAIDNFNIIEASQDIYNYNASLQCKPNKSSNKCPYLKPKSVSEVIKSTGLVH